MWNSHLYLDLALYRSEHVGALQPNPGLGFPVNIVGVAPYWRVAWQESTGTTQFMIGSYGMHLKSTNGLINNGAGDLYDGYTDWPSTPNTIGHYSGRHSFAKRHLYPRKLQFGISANTGAASPGGIT